MKKIKVAYVVHGLGAEGISSFTANLMSKLDMNRFDISVIMAVDDNGVSQVREDEVRSYGVSMYRTCDLGSVKKAKNHLKLLKGLLLSTGPYDVIHTNMDKLNGFNLLIAKQVGIPCRISHSHISAGVDYDSFIKQFVSRVYKICMKILINRYSTVRLGCSDIANNYLYGKASAQVVPNGIDTARFVDCTVDVDDYKLKLGVDPEKRLLVNVARVSYQKNPLFMAEIIKELSKIRNDFVFLWIGSGELSDKLKEKINEYKLNDCFILAGVHSDIPEILHCADLFLLPSVFEGMPISIIEAQCSGCKCILSDTITEMVDMGICTFLPINSAKRWADEIDRQLNDETQKEIPAERIKEFDVKTMAEKIEDVYVLGCKY